MEHQTQRPRKKKGRSLNQAERGGISKPGPVPLQPSSRRDVGHSRHETPCSEGGNDKRTEKAEPNRHTQRAPEGSYTRLSEVDMNSKGGKTSLKKDGRTS